MDYVALPTGAPDYERAFFGAKEKFRRLVNEKSREEIMDLGSSFCRNFLIAHVAFVCKEQGKKDTTNEIEKFKQDFKLDFMDEKSFFQESEEKLARYYDIGSGEVVVDALFSMFLFGLWQRHVLSFLLPPEKLPRGVIVNAYNKDSILRASSIISSGKVDLSKSGDFFVF